MTPFQQTIHSSSHTALQLVLTPVEFAEVSAQIRAEERAAQNALLAEQQAAMAAEESDAVSVSMSLVPDGSESATLEATAEPLAMAAESSTPPPPGGGGGNTNNATGGGSSNLVVQLSISGFGTDYIEIYTKEDLVFPTNWTAADTWVPSYGEDPILWTDPASSNKMQRFYFIVDAADMDGDGHSDQYEAWHGTASNIFDFVDADSDGMHDWWEEKLFGDISSQTGTNDFDGDGLLNNEELIPGQPPVMITDPSLYSSDGDVLGDGEMYASPATDPWNPDVDRPSASISWPTNNAVLAF